MGCGLLALAANDRCNRPAACNDETFGQMGAVPNMAVDHTGRAFLDAADDIGADVDNHSRDELVAAPVALFALLASFVVFEQLEKDVAIDGLEVLVRHVQFSADAGGCAVSATFAGFGCVAFIFAAASIAFCWRSSFSF